MQMQHLFTGYYKKQELSRTILEKLHILPTSSASREGLAELVSQHFSPTTSPGTYHSFLPVLVIQLTKDPRAEVDILLSGLDLSGLDASNDGKTSLIYDLYALCLYNAEQRHYRAVTYSSCLNKWILYE